MGPPAAIRPDPLETAGFPVIMAGRLFQSERIEACPRILLDIRIEVGAIINRFRPPSRYKARQLDRIRLICNATGFIQAIQRGIQQGLI